MIFATLYDECARHKHRKVNNQNNYIKAINLI